MELLEYLNIIEKKLKSSFDIKRNYTLNNIQFDMFAEYHLRNEKYVLVKKQLYTHLKITNILLSSIVKN